MKILVIGHKGMIGQEIVKAHIKYGDTVYGYDLEVNQYIDYTKKYAGIEIPPSIGMLDNFLSESKIDLISYQGALVGVGESQYMLSKYTDYNIQKQAEFMELLVKHRIRAPIIHAGSMAPYGEGVYFCSNCDRSVIPDKRVMDGAICPVCLSLLDKDGKMHSCETDQLCPTSTYGITKMTQELLWKNYSFIHDIPVASLRYFSVYGLEQSPLNPKTGVLNMLANQILNRRKIELNEDGEQTRDMVNVSVIGLLHFSLSCKVDEGFYAYNVCTGRSYSLNEMACKMSDAMNSNCPITHTSTCRKGDIRHVSGSNFRLRQHGFTIEDTLSYDIEQYGSWVMANKEMFTGDTWAEEKERCKKGGIQ